MTTIRIKCTYCGALRAIDTEIFYRGRNANPCHAGYKMKIMTDAEVAQAQELAKKSKSEYTETIQEKLQRLKADPGYDERVKEFDELQKARFHREMGE